MASETCSAASGKYLLSGSHQLKLMARRYCNVDYVFLSSLIGVTILYLLATYDIACQFELYFVQRLESFPSHLQIELPSGPGELRWAIPKYHFRAHKEEGHNQYSLHLMSGVGRVSRLRSVRQSRPQC